MCRRPDHNFVDSSNDDDNVDDLASVGDGDLPVSGHRHRPRAGVHQANNKKSGINSSLTVLPSFLIGQSRRNPFDSRPSPAPHCPAHSCCHPAPAAKLRSEVLLITHRYFETRPQLEPDNCEQDLKKDSSEPNRSRMD